MQIFSKGPLRRAASCLLVLLTCGSLFGCAAPGTSQVTAQAADTDPSLDFSSYRLVLTTEDPDILRPEDTILGSYGSVYLLAFENEEETKDAYIDYQTLAESVEPDVLIQSAEETEETPETIPMDESENPMVLLEALEPSEEPVEESGVIALIDTGVSESDSVIDRVSVLDNKLEGNGHGDQMVAAITSQDTDAKILSIRALDDSGFGTVSSLAAAMEYAIEQKVDLINLSLYARTTPATSVLKQEIQKAVEAGIPVIGAAGNDNADVADYMPGSVEEAYIIGAAKEDGSRLKTSNYGDTVDYNVVAGSTSEAAALFTGFLSAFGAEEIPSILNQGLIYTPDYQVPEETPEEPLPPETDLSQYPVDTSRRVIVKYLYVHADAVTPEDTIDSVFDKVFATDAENYDYAKYIVGTSEVSDAELYDMGDGTYRFKADAPIQGGFLSGDAYLDWTFAYGTNDGEVITDGVDFDPALGVATVDKAVFRDNPEDFTDLQFQVMVPVEADGVINFTQEVEVVNADGSSYNMTAAMTSFGQEKLPFAVTGDLTSEDFVVYVNDEANPTPVTWDNEQHLLNVNRYSDTIYKLRIELQKETDAVFQAAQAGRHSTPMFYLPEGTDVSYLKTLPSYTDPDCSGGDPRRNQWAALYRIGYETTSPAPDTIIGHVTEGIDGLDWAEGDYLGVVGFYKGLFGLKTPSGGNYGFVCCNSSGKAYGNWKSSAETLTTHNAGIYMPCVHVGSGLPWTANTRMRMTYQITDTWTSGDYTYFSMVCYGQRKLNGNSLGQTAGGSLVFAVKDKSYAKLTLQKSSGNTAVTNENSSYYSLAGAEYYVYTDAACTKRALTKDGEYAVLKTVANGSTNTVTLEVGTYYIKEHKAPSGYLLDPTKHGPYKLTASYTTTALKASVSQTPKTGNLRIVKESSLPNITDNNRCYSFEGAQFTIYRDSACTDAYKTITTNKDGVASLTGMPMREYWVKETKAPEHYQLNTSWKEHISITANHTTSAPLKLTCKDVPGNDPAGISITKIWNGLKTDTIPTLEGTQFTINYYDDMSMTEEEVKSTEPTRTWVLEIKYEESIDQYATLLDDYYVVEDLSDEFYRDDANQAVLPYGTITIQETKAAAGYTLDGYLKTSDGTVVSQDSALFMTTVDGPASMPKLKGGNEYEGFNTPIVGSISLTKYDTDGTTPLAGVTFQCEGKTVGDTRTVTTDKNGKCTFDNLYPDVYTITETATIDGRELLSEPLTVEVPMRITDEYIEEFDVDLDSTIYDPADDIYYIHNFAYDVSNNVSLEMPMAGGLLDPKVILPMVTGLILLGASGILLLRRRPK